MQIRNTSGGQRHWLPVLALLAGLLAACAAAQSSTPTLSSATSTALAVATVAPAATAPATDAATESSPTVAPTVAILASPTVAATNGPTTRAATAVPATATANPAVVAVLAYLNARAKSDVTAVTNLSCKAWRPKAVTEAISFRSMNAKLVGVTCQVNGSAGSFTLVGCGGKMVTTYGTESRDWDLSAFVYQVTAEDGQWKMCGYH